MKERFEEFIVAFSVIGAICTVIYFGFDIAGVWSVASVPWWIIFVCAFAFATLWVALRR